jgi:hypothetical protein
MKPLYAKKREKKRMEKPLPQWMRDRGDKTKDKNYEEIPLYADTTSCVNVRTEWM